MKNFSLGITSVSLAALTLLSGCNATFPLIPDSPRSDSSAARGESDGSSAQASAVAAMPALGEPAVSYTPAPIPRPRTVGAGVATPLPEVCVCQPLHVPAGAPLSAALNLALMGSGISYVLSEDAPPASKAELHGIKGSLAQVLQVLERAYGVFFSYENGVLWVKTTRQFVIEMPSQFDTLNSTATTLPARGAKDVTVDSVSGQITYKATPAVAKSIELYFSELLNQPLITVELNIYEVRLNEGNQFGIQWNKFLLENGSQSIGFTGASPMQGAGSLGIAGNLLNGKLSIDLLMKFLATQGRVKTVAQPKVQFISGNKTSVEVGDTIRYTNQIGAAQVGNTTATQTTAQVTELQTGLSLMVAGRWWEETVIVSMQMSMVDLLGFDTLPISEKQVLQVPRTTKRNSGENTLRLKPGQIGLFYGVLTEQKSSDRSSFSNIPFLRELTTTNKKDSAAKTELVVVLRPRVTMFSEPPVQASSQVK